jgi:hypothetical protein
MDAGLNRIYARPFLGRWRYIVLFPTICFSTVSLSSLAAVAPHQSPGGSSPYGSLELEGTDRYINI